MNTALMNSFVPNQLEGHRATARAPERWPLPNSLLVLFVLIWAALAISPLSRSDWLLENLLVFAAIPWFIGTRRAMPFTNGSYVCLFAFFVLHAIGAHYTYSLVPYDRWWEALTGHSLNATMGWRRNHYDRLIHFAYGLLILPPAFELLERYARLRGVWRWIVPVAFVMSHSVLYEVMEWTAAIVVAPDLGDAYLGTQGDIWDAQKDMALAAAGAVLSMLTIGLVKRRRAFGRAVQIRGGTEEARGCSYSRSPRERGR